MKDQQLPWLVAGLLVGALIGYLTAMALTKAPARMGEVPPDGGAVRPGARACTMEAKMCPDGSAVGRVSPNCEFAPCPGEPAQPPSKPMGL